LPKRFGQKFPELSKSGNKTLNKIIKKRYEERLLEKTAQTVYVQCDYIHKNKAHGSQENKRRKNIITTSNVFVFLVLSKLIGNLSSVL
jgi:hypothetical protein